MTRHNLWGWPEHAVGGQQSMSSAPSGGEQKCGGGGAEPGTCASVSVHGTLPVTENRTKVQEVSTVSRALRTIPGCLCGLGLTSSLLNLSAPAHNSPTPVP